MITSRSRVSGREINTSFNEPIFSKSREFGDSEIKLGNEKLVLGNNYVRNIKSSINGRFSNQKTN